MAEIDARDRKIYRGQETQGTKLYAVYQMN